MPSRSFLVDTFALMIRRTLIVLAVCAPLAIAGCQCSDKPDIGPVEDDNAHQIAPEVESAPAAAPLHA
ncbi:MAG: hypothetical protein R6U20_07025 [Longimonas sp.]|uniref:hypothetical protein n=1 Tax=Longimonas sp. TaxID=2039626 RepID=UPI003976AB01